tara:strand:- start:1254 stop:1856 length:603 start_codon:yes stop_codon:yes gene_type:complete
MQLETLFIFFLTTSLLTLSPGPDIVYVFIKSSTGGLKAGVKTVFGLTTGLIFHTFLLVFGISALINTNEQILFFLKLFGFLYFLFFSLNIFFQNRKPKSSFFEKTYDDFYVGLMMNLLNPKVSLFFIALFPGFIFSDELITEIQFLVLGFIFWLTSTLIFLIVVFISWKFKNKVQSQLENKNLKNIQAIVYFLIAIWIIK